MTMIGRNGLRALIHPLTDDDLADHTTLAHWVGEPLALAHSTRNAVMQAGSRVRGGLDCGA